MYEASFGLKRRPFAATPDATCFLSSGPIQAALDELVVCVEHGQGIAVLTAPAGTGKTLLCERLRFELGDRYETVFLRHASFLTRRALLQTVLCELNHAYHHPSEQELRLELFPAIRALQPKREALVLICDEAHQLTDSLLEELRILADFAEQGRPLVRLVLVGQLSLEEKLAQPSLEAFNQRIRAHVNLSTFDLAGSLDYIDYRLTWAGGRTDEVFTPSALDLIAKVSDGVPRCINQLADHTLLLAFVSEQRPASEALVREALTDLRQLPLHWNEPSMSVTDRTHQTTDDADSRNTPVLSNQNPSGFLTNSETNAAMYSYEPEVESNVNSNKIDSYDVGTNEVPLDTPESLALLTLAAVDLEPVDVSGDNWRQTLDLFNPHSEETRLMDVMSGLTSKSRSTADNDTASHETDHTHFHELLHDAFVAAGKQSTLTPEIEPSTRVEFVQTLNTDSIPWNTTGEVRNPIETDQSQPSFVSTTNSIAFQPANGFYEEVIVDRYAAIDAGFEPPVTPTTDTGSSHEVRTDQILRLEQSHDLPTDRLNNSAIESMQSNRFDEEALVRWGGEVPTLANWPNVPRNTADRDDIEQVADEVSLLAHSIRSTGTLSSTTESLLEVLRHEVGEQGTTGERNSVLPRPMSPVETSWESIETPEVETSTESRPLRYLFSMLRRKQQGLA